MSTHPHSWAFEAHSIQGFILETGRLADAVGASLLVDRLTGDLGDDAGAGNLLSTVLAVTGVASDAVRFSRRGGGAFIAFFAHEDARAAARTLWQAALHVNAPGLRWSDGVADVTGGFREAAASALKACQTASRIETARLPEPGPAVLRVSRTGQPAVARQRIGDKGVEAVDAATRARRRHGTVVAGVRVLTDRFCDQKGLVWPRNMEQTDAYEDPAAPPEPARRRAQRFPFAGDDHEVAFLHADGNGLGVLLQELAKVPEKDYLGTYMAFSRAVSEATREAATDASMKSLLPYARHNEDGSRTMPARPLVLGGDDLSIIVRADLALDFAETFLTAFERHAATRLGQVRLGGGKLSGLTAACGVAFVKSTFPYLMASDLAEQLCARAKRAIKAEAALRQRKMPLSAIAVQRVTTALAETELPGFEWQGQRRTLGLEAYVLAPDSTKVALPRWTDLRALAGRLSQDASPRGPARKLLIDMHQDPGQAVERYRRWRELRQAADAQGLQQTDAALARLGVPNGAELPIGPHGSPWPDALLLAALARAAPPAQIEAATTEVGR